MADELCPRCGSNHVQEFGYWRSAGLLISAGCGGCFFLILGTVLLSVSAILGAPLIGIGIVVLALGILAYFIMIFKGRLCADCKHRWVVKKAEKAS
ncbi:hypothetical protein [Kroppenstedtia guangzhouensis]|uniref:hypothetical protein n=1 Tax=Kroppenstedtia guangzhouensis TaxID=1274356 RepID=UPI001666CE95|nr:hypothetical protein [Kroppenstedtia guangzhouensis]